MSAEAVPPSSIADGYPSDGLGSMRFSELLEAIAAKRPTPGGGATAAATGATAAALASMVVEYSVGKKSLAEHRASLNEAALWLGRMRDQMLALGDRDARAYGELNAAMKLAEGDPEKARRMRPAVAGAIAAPMEVLENAGELLARIESLVPITNPWLRSDLAISGILARAAACGASWNVRVNTPLVADESERRDIESRVGDALQAAESAATRIEGLCASCQ